MTAYQPGICNIGRGERRKRYAVGTLGFAAAVGAVAAVAALALPDWTLLVAAVPLFAGFLGVYQARFGFCAGFAAAGVHDAGDEGRVEVSDEGARRADRRRARRITGYAAASALLVTALVYVALA